MTTITVHRFTKTKKPISVNGQSFGKAVLKDGIWTISNNSGKVIEKSMTIRNIEFAVQSYFKAVDAGIRAKV